MDPRPSPRVVIVQAAGLGPEVLRTHGLPTPAGLHFRPLEAPFPALTCTAQATFRTATPASAHGMVANGRFHRELGRALFWEQSARLVAGPRIWEPWRAAGLKVALLFWQQSLGEDVDQLLSPQPIHRHGGGLVDAVHSRPAGLYDELARSLGRPFRLHRYWGPLASPAASDWIARATAELIVRPDAPDICLTYLPALDYDLQRFGPNNPRGTPAVEALAAQLSVIRAACDVAGYDLLVFGDYAMGQVTHGPIYPNRSLRNAGRFAFRMVRGRSYADLHNSDAFALVDHEVAHVYLRRREDCMAVAQELESLKGVECAVPPAAYRGGTADHPNAGELLLVARPGWWFAYPWWTESAEEPDFAGHVDIHNKPGYDPCELFFGWPPLSVSRDATRIRGSHGRVGPDRCSAWAATWSPAEEPRTLIDLAKAVDARVRHGAGIAS